MSIIDGPIPKHTYETTGGTQPIANGQHEPRTMTHAVTIDDKSDLVSMMSEIGDGQFVAWTECRKCRKHLTQCGCPDGPAEPEYMQVWRDKRFVRTLNERPDPSYTMIPSVISWLEERGYTVTKEVAPEPEDDSNFDDDGNRITPTGETPDTTVAEQVDTGLDKAIDAVKQERNLDDIDAGF